MANTVSQALLKELNAEYRATRACLERIPASLFEYRPHPSSMTLGYLSLLVAEIPLWIKYMVVEGEINFATFQHAKITSTEELVRHFEANMKEARAALEGATDKDLQENFSLKTGDQLLYSAPKAVDVGVTINHWVHHRGQLTVYMRLTEIPVPSVYGPSGDEKNFEKPS